MQSVISTERTANGKGSQIRKSLRTTIGKLTSGFEKRNLHNTLEIKSYVTRDISDLKSPIMTHAKVARRESLTGVQTSDRSRRSSLGGKPYESSTPIRNNRNAKTPPPVHPSTKTTKRWL